MNIPLPAYPHSPIQSIQQLLQVSSHFKHPVLINNFFDDRFINESMIREGINQAVAQRASEYFRVWLEGRERQDAVSVIMNNPIPSEESIENWAQRIFSCQKFCLFFNRVEQFFDPLTASLGYFLEGIYQEHGMPMGGASMVFLIGNYGYTPNGMHQDIGEHTIFHFHLGPGNKTLYLLEPNKFIEITGSKEACLDPSKVVPYAETYELTPGAFLSFPPEHFHIGHTKEFSIGVAVVLSDFDNVQLLREVFMNVGLEGLTRVKTIQPLPALTWHSNPSENAPELINKLALSASVLGRSLEDLARSELENRQFKIMCNLGWSFPPIFLNYKDVDITKTKIQLKRPFKIFYKVEAQDRISIFLRGRELISRNFYGLTTLIDLINQGNVIEVSHILRQQKDQKSADNIIPFLHQALEHCAINLV